MNIEFTWSYSGENLEVVDSYIYLGMKFTLNGSFETGIKPLSDQALKAVNNLLSLFQRVHFDIKTKTFTAWLTSNPHFVVWFRSMGCIDKIHIKVCKIILGVRAQTTNYAVYGELGRYLLAIIAKERATTFWLKMLNNTHSLISKIFTDRINKIENRLIHSHRNSAKRHWASLMKDFI